MNKLKSNFKVLAPILVVITTLCSMFGYAMLSRQFPNDSLLNDFFFHSGAIQLTFFTLFLVTDMLSEMKKRDDNVGLYVCLALNVQPFLTLAIVGIVGLIQYCLSLTRKSLKIL